MGLMPVQSVVKVQMENTNSKDHSLNAKRKYMQYCIKIIYILLLSRLNNCLLINIIMHFCPFEG